MNAAEFWTETGSVLDLVAESMQESWERNESRAETCGCRGCRQSLAELKAWLFGPTSVSAAMAQDRSSLFSMSS
jgi:hypothetical protein